LAALQELRAVASVGHVVRAAVPSRSGFTINQIGRLIEGVRHQKMTFGEMRESGVWVYCRDYHRSRPLLVGEFSDSIGVGRQAALIRPSVETARREARRRCRIRAAVRRKQVRDGNELTPRTAGTTQFEIFLAIRLCVLAPMNGSRSMLHDPLF
jgi:hypothetical protein